MAILNQFGLKSQFMQHCQIPTFGSNLTIPRAGLHKKPPQKELWHGPLVTFGKNATLIFCLIFFDGALSHKK